MPQLRHTRIGLCVLLALAVAAPGCQCRTQEVGATVGQLKVVWTNAAGETVEDLNATYDFGQALIGQSRELNLVVRNKGARDLNLESLAFDSGDAVAIAGMGTEAFSVQFRQGAVLQPGETIEFPMVFSPRILKARYQSVLKLTASGTRAEDSIATITLIAGGEAGDCNVPDVIDFGNTPIGETFTYPIMLRNPSTVSANASVGDITGADAASFGFADGSPRGSFSVEAMMSKTITVTFKPTEKRAYAAEVTIQGVGECPSKTVTIKGNGSDRGLTWTPNELNFGFVNPGDEAVKEIVFDNPSGGQITLTGVATAAPNGSDFYQVVMPGQDATRYTVAPGTSRMRVACSPQALGERTSTLSFSTGLMNPAMGSIRLKCTGGGPRIRVTPRPSLAFGRVGFFPGSTTFSVTRKLTIRNVGSRPRESDGGVILAGNLFMGTVRMDGTPGEMPYYELANTTGLDTGELAVTLGGGSSPVGYDPSVGLEATPGNFVDLAVTLNPRSAGRKSADIVIYSNDGSEPQVRITVTADVQQLPPCNFRIDPQPPPLNFGLVSPGARKELPVTITNLGTQPTDICYLSGIDLSPGTNPAYSIAGGPIVEKELMPRETFTVNVRVEPPGPVPMRLTSLAGELSFNVSSPTTPRGRMALLTSVGPSCLVVTPDPVDFGVTKVGCNSPAKTLNIYNSCSNDVFIRSRMQLGGSTDPIRVQAAGGQPAGGPNCAGATPCPEFRVLTVPTIPATGLRIPGSAAPVTFQVRYSPIDNGADTGAVAIEALQDGQPITYLVGLAARADNTGIQTDTYVQDAQPKADVLLVVDDSGSMNDKQMNLSNNFASFIQFATAANVDYQIGVTTTTFDESQVCVPVFGCTMPTSTAAQGKLRKIAPTATTPAVGPILTQRTANVATRFRDLVRVGIDGSGEERGLDAALAALTPPLSVTENAGFIRPDANLAVVVITDAEDQSPQPIAYYENRLINVKGFNRLSQFTFNNIGPYNAPQPPAGSNCSYDADPEPAPARYRQLVTRTAGVRGEICNTNWAAILQQLGQTAFGARTEFFLNNLPDTAVMGMPVSVKINGMTVPMGPTGWTYDSAANSIKFSNASRPQPGQTLTITYPIACL
jgi:hypothetical protein